MLTCTTHVFIIIGMDALNKAIAIFGSQSELSRAIGTDQQTVYNWLKRQNVPAERCPAIERATGGVVRCEDLRPDVDWAVLRGTVTAEPVA